MKRKTEVTFFSIFYPQVCNNRPGGQGTVYIEDKFCFGKRSIMLRHRSLGGDCDYCQNNFIPSHITKHHPASDINQEYLTRNIICRHLSRVYLQPGADLRHSDLAWLDQQQHEPRDLRLLQPRLQKARDNRDNRFSIGVFRAFVKILRVCCAWRFFDRCFKDVKRKTQNRFVSISYR